MKRICAVFACWSASLCLAQQVGVFEGEVVRSRLDRGSLWIELRPQGLEPARRVDLGSDGKFQFSDVPIGNYLLRITDSAGNEVSTQPLRVAPANAHIEVQLPEPKAERPSGETVSMARLRHAPNKRVWRELIKAQRLSESGRHDEASVILENAVRLDPEFIEAHGNLGAEYALLGRFDSAVVALKRAIALDPASAQFPSNLAYALLHLRQPEEAVTWARKAVYLDGSNPKARYVLGCTLAARAETRTAGIEQLQFAARSYPSAHRMLAAVYQALGRLDLAEKETQQYLQSLPPATPTTALSSAAALLP